MKRVKEEIRWIERNIEDQTIRTEMIKDQQGKLEHHYLARMELKSALIELEIMKDHNIIFEIKKVDKLGNGPYYTKRNVLGNIIVEWDGSDRGLLAHELEHGYQHLTGEADWLPGTEDIFDELDAYSRQLAYYNDYTIQLEDGSKLSYDNLSTANIKSLAKGVYSDLPEKRKNTNPPLYTPSKKRLKKIRKVQDRLNRH